MQLVYGTANPAKIGWMKKALKGLEIDIIGIKELETNLPLVPEEGNTPLENAREKAAAYYRVLHRPVFSCDSGLYIEGLPDELQPGIHVRRVKEKVLTDEEMLEYYGSLARQYGGLKARYWNAVCLVVNEDEIYERMDESLASSPFLLVSEPHGHVTEGFPLDSLSVDIRSGRYFNDQPDGAETDGGDSDEMEGFTDFFRQALNLSEEKREGNGCGQYETAGNLKQRISIHDKYSENRQGFGNWLREQYRIPEKGKILELGCGTGQIWKDAELPAGVRLYLTDFSEGMLKEAKENLRQKDHIFYEVVNIQSIPYKDASFDVVIANMMLYHVPDLDRALQEVRRVLKTGGLFYCATYGENGIPSWLQEVFKEYPADIQLNRNFTLQNGAACLEKYFKKVELRQYPDALNITETEDLLAYILSMDSMAELREYPRDEMLRILDEKRVNGVIHIPKEYGMFAAE